MANIKDLQNQAAALVQKEKTKWEDATVYITDKVSFQMRTLIKKLRKNYYGIFDTPIDPVSGRKKVFIPMTESLVEAVVKNIDLDQKDINFRAKQPAYTRWSHIVKSYVKSRLDKMFFGEKLDRLERDVAIDGTGVWRTDGDEPKRVDLLNCYIDPTADSIQEADSFIERIVLSIDEFKKIAKDGGWVNTDIEGVLDVDKAESTLQNPRADIEYVEIFRRYGKTPRKFITGKGEDLIEAEMIVSVVDGTWTFHAAQKWNKPKPYEEAWYIRVPGRWYGKGIAEKVMMLQEYLNIIVNIRINRSYISQLGIFKIRRGSGITPQSLSRLVTNGAVLVKHPDDLQQLVMDEASQASYNDEENIQSWAQRVTSAFETVTGEQLPASVTATTSALQSRSAQSQFTLIKEGIGMFLQRWASRHYLPNTIKKLTAGDMIRVTGEPDVLRDFDEMWVNSQLADQIDAIRADGGHVDPEQVERERQAALQRLKTSKDRFVNMVEDLNLGEFDVEVYITNEEVDKAVLAQNLITALQAVPEFRNELIPQIFDLMGLNPPRLPETPVQGQIEANNAAPGAQGAPGTAQQPDYANQSRQLNLANQTGLQSQATTFAK